MCVRNNKTLTVVMIIFILFSHYYMVSDCSGAFLSLKTDPGSRQEMSVERLSSGNTTLNDVVAAEDFFRAAFEKYRYTNIEINFNFALVMWLGVVVALANHCLKTYKKKFPECVVHGRIIAFIHSEDGKKERYMHFFTDSK